MCPYPPSAKALWFAFSRASSNVFARYIPSTGDNFRVQILQKCLDSTSPIRIFVFSGTSTPASFAISYADFPGILLFNAPFIINRLTNLIKLFSFFQEVAASVCKFFLYFIVNAVQNRYGLLGSTNHTVVKCLGMNDGVNCKFNICCVVDNNRCISGANSKCWFPEE